MRGVSGSHEAPLQPKPEQIRSLKQESDLGRFTCTSGYVFYHLRWPVFVWRLTIAVLFIIHIIGLWPYLTDPTLFFHLFLTTGLNKVIDIYPTEAVNLPVNFTPVSLSQWPLVLPPVVFNLFFSFTEIINVGFRIVACLSCSSWGQLLKVELDVLKPLENIKCSV